jgi:hypothetical protein
MDMHAGVDTDCESSFERCQLTRWSIGFSEVNSFLLGASLRAQASLELHKVATSVKLLAEDPDCSKEMAIRGGWYHCPDA